MEANPPTLHVSQRISQYFFLFFLYFTLKFWRFALPGEGGRSPLPLATPLKSEPGQQTRHLSWGRGNCPPPPRNPWGGGGKMMIFPQENKINTKKLGVSFHSGPNLRRKLFLRGVYDDFIAKIAKNFHTCGAIYFSG